MKKLLLNFLCICVIFSLTGCSREEKYTIKDKLDSETEYIENLIFKIVIKHAKGEYEEEGKINWDYIKGDINKINSSWNLMIIDLSTVGVENKEILQYSDDLNNLLLSIANNDELTMIDKLNSIYKKIIDFRDVYSDNKNEIEKNRIKSSILNSYYFANIMQYENGKIDIDKTIEKYKELMKNDDYKKENNYNLNKIYILLQEYRNSFNTGELDLIKLKFILTIEEL